MDYIDQIFGDGGLLATSLPGYELRPGQIQLAKAIDQAMCKGKHCLAEGPCGTGKSLAYGVPAIAHAAANKVRIVIATANINLQEQLAYKDIPFLRDILPWDFRFALLKGKNNYYCREREFASHADGSLKRVPRKLAGQVTKVLNWAKVTSAGDKSELDFDPDPQVWRLVSSGTDDCKGRNCSFRNECYYNAAKNTARKADIVVTNYHMLFAHIAVRRMSGDDLVLPPYTFLILDEAHEAANIARDFLGFSLSKFAVRDMARWARQSNQEELGLELEKAGEKFFQTVSSVGKASSYNIRLRAPNWDKNKHRELKQRLGELIDVAKTYATSPDIGEEEVLAAFDTMRRAKAFIARMNEAVGLTDQNCAYWIEFSRAGHPMVKSKPMDVSGMLHSELFEATRTVVMTSATLTTGGNFDFLKTETGAPPGCIEVVGDSPFDYGTQCLFVVPQTMPSPKDPNFPYATATSAGEVIRACRGRTLCLFTSNKNMISTYDTLSASGLPYRMLRQNDGIGRADLYKIFKEDESSCLFGVASFWTGVDIPGQALTGLVIDKLPFPNMSDPLVNAISEKDKKSFWKFMVPKAIIGLRQGIGRLIRTKTDHGVVAVLDNRLLGGSRYAKQFLLSLPPMRTTANLGDVPAFIEHFEG